MSLHFAGRLGPETVNRLAPQAEIYFLKRRNQMLMVNCTRVRATDHLTGTDLTERRRPSISVGVTSQELSSNRQFTRGRQHIRHGRVLI
jgi:hypothetical protein